MGQAGVVKVWVGALHSLGVVPAFIWDWVVGCVYPRIDELVISPFRLCVCVCVCHGVGVILST